jgi:hypothetical protein
MKKQNVLSRSSKMKAIGLNDQQFSVNTTSFINTVRVQLIPGVTCTNGCKRYDSKTFIQLSYNNNNVIRLYISPSLYSGRIQSSIGMPSLDKIRILNFSGYYFNIPINITFIGKNDSGLPEYQFDSENDRVNFMKLFDSARYELYDGRVEPILVKDGLFPDGLLIKLQEGSQIVYEVRADYFTLDI